MFQFETEASTKGSKIVAFPKTFAEMKDAGYHFSNGSSCRDCHADIEWWETPKGKKMPMNAMETRDDAPAIAHWTTCPNAESFRKPR